MKKTLLAFLLISAFIQCSKGDSSVPLNLPELELNFGPQTTTLPFEGQYTFFKDVPYGTKPQNKLDILLPSESDMKGVVLYFHGGGFLSGSKEDLYLSPSKEFVQELLAADIVVINAAYTFISDEASQGVFTALEEGTQVIEFTERNAALMGIPSQQIVLAGVSAGAGIAQWNGFHNETNESIRGIVATFAQSSYDLYEWEKLFPDYSLDSLRTKYEELETLFTDFYNGDADEEKRALLDYRNFMDPTDPPFYVFNPVYENAFIDANDSLDFNVLFHSVKHADYLRKKALTVGLEFSGGYKEAPEAFIERVLSK